MRHRCSGSARSPAWGTEDDVGICITCSNIKRTPAWPDSTSMSAGRYAHRDVFLTVSNRSFLSFSLSLLVRSSLRRYMLSTVRRIFLFFSFVASISATFLTSVLLFFLPLDVSQIIASSKGCREQKIFKYLRRRRSEINSRTRRVIRSACFF